MEGVALLLGAIEQIRWQCLRSLLEGLEVYLAERREEGASCSLYCHRQNYYLQLAYLILIYHVWADVAVTRTPGLTWKHMQQLQTSGCGPAANRIPQDGSQLGVWDGRKDNPGWLLGGGVFELNKGTKGSGKSSLSSTKL